MLRRFAAARQQNGKHNQNGDRADINQDLRKADELRAQLQVSRRQSREGDSQGQRAMHQVAQAHRRHGGGNGQQQQ